MEWHDILQRIESGESEVTEFKQMFTSDTAGKAICAFANSKGGVLIIGVTDNGEIVGVQDPKISEQITNLLISGCSAPIDGALSFHNDPKGLVYWVEVPKLRSGEPCLHHGKAYVRRGRSSVVPSSRQLQELYNRFGFVMTEEQVMSSATVSDIDINCFHVFLKDQGLEYSEEPQIKIQDDLRNRGVLEGGNGQLHPTLYGLLAFGKHPQSHRQTGNFHVCCVVYAGTDQAAETLTVSEASGRLDEQVKHALDWLVSLGRFEKYEGVIRRDLPLVPQKVIREALVNAVIHRDYVITGSKVMLEVFSDRIVVTSPGTLPNHITVARAKAGGNPRSRNESMAMFMLEKQFMEKRGRGWLIMSKLMREFNGTCPEMEHDEQSQFVRVILKIDPR